MTMFDESLLDSGGRGLAQALCTAAVIVVTLLGVAILVPVTILVNLVGAPPGVSPPSTVSVTQPSTATLPSEAGVAPVAVARAYLGIPYVFGGTDPRVGLDCSGLVQLVFRQLGISLPRTAQQQYNATARVERGQLQPGDLVFFARTYADPNDFVTHVGIYIGDGMQINAPTEGQTVSIQPVFTGFWGAHFLSGGRPNAGRT